MSNGFQADTNETTIAIICKRLKPSCDRQDEVAFLNGVARMTERYGSDAVHAAIGRLMQDFPWLRERACENMSIDQKELVYGEAYDVIANQLEKAGLRLEEHFRVSDRGVALSREAVRVMAATGFPRIEAFGDGNESLEGVGIDRNPFIHPLAEAIDSEFVNSWSAISIFISAALGWFQEGGDRVTAKEFLGKCIAQAAPTTDLDKLLYRARYDDRALLKLANDAERGFNAIATKAVGES